MTRDEQAEIDGTRLVETKVKKRLVRPSRCRLAALLAALLLIFLFWYVSQHIHRAPP